MIETPRLRLRRWEARDLAPFAALNADALVMAHMPRVLTREESDGLVSRIEDRWRDDGICFAVAERRFDGAFVGMVGLARLKLEGLPRPCVEVGWRLARPFWRQGYASEAARAWLGHGFGTMDLDEIVAITVPANTASLKVMRRLGMREQPERAFPHPNLPVGHRLRAHLLHAIDHRTWDLTAGAVAADRAFHA